MTKKQLREVKKIGKLKCTTNIVVYTRALEILGYKCIYSLSNKSIIATKEVLQCQLER